MALVAVVLGVDAGTVVVQVVSALSTVRVRRPEVAVRSLIPLTIVVPIPVAVVLEALPNIKRQKGRLCLRSARKSSADDGLNSALRQVHPGFSRGVRW